MLDRTLRSSILSLAFLFLSAACGSPSTETGESAEAPQGRLIVSIRVDADGYHPPRAAAPAGQPVRLMFTRTSDEGCGQQVVFPDLDIRRDLPLNERVPVDITMPESGSVSFTCGMAMYQGSVVAR